jgi:hypothetical protein
MILLGKIALGMVGAAVASAGLLCSEGFVDVNVVQRRDSPPHIHVIAPAMLVPIAVRLVSNEKLAEASERIQPWLPAIHAAMDGLSDSPDMTLVDVSDPDEYVTVTKEGGDIVVDVADRDETVHVSAPIRAIRSTADALAESRRLPGH